MLPKIVVAALFVAIFVGLIVKSARELSDNRGRAVWWQNIDPWRWIIIACYIPITVLIAAWPAIPLGLMLLIFVLPLVMITALSIARLIGIYLSERDEVNRNRALGEPTHAYLKSTTAIILVVELIMALAVLVAAAMIHERKPLTRTMINVSDGLFYLSVALVVFGVVHCLYRRARRHHENVLAALHRAESPISARRTASAGVAR